LERSIYIRHSIATIIGVCILIAGAALGVGLSSWTGSSVFGASHQVPVYINQAGDVGGAVPSNAMGFAPIFKPALPAVVSITSSRIVKAPQSPFFNDPFFQQFFGGQSPQGPQQQRERGLGSGVIVSSDGYILTNNHVIDKATDIKVQLADKRQFTGKVVGADPKTDIAVVKIAATGLPTITLGDSTKIQVGDYAFAIGNPFGVGETATMGIISATGRNGLQIESYEDFIQTDAAINPGNSGGALLNARGELIGINTAILAGNSGGNQGIGFAIPINMAKYVMDQILKHGKVVRGYIGVGIEDVTSSIAKVFNVPADKGALISDVQPDSPGGKAGLSRGDVVMELNGEPIKDANDLRLKVATMTPGTVAHLKVNHNGQTHDVDVTLGEVPASQNGGNESENAAGNSSMHGVQVQDLSDDIRQQLGLKADVKGVVVTSVADDSPAADAGLQRGDVIEQVNRQNVNSVAEYQRMVDHAGNQSVVLLVNRGGNTTFLVVQPE
jgi:serine protease Do